MCLVLLHFILFDSCQCIISRIKKLYIVYLQLFLKENPSLWVEGKDTRKAHTHKKEEEGKYGRNLPEVLQHVGTTCPVKKLRNFRMKSLDLCRIAAKVSFASLSCHLQNIACSTELWWSEPNICTREILHVAYSQVVLYLFNFQ